MKTGTPPRLDGTTINYEELEMQDADKKPYFFSYLTKKINAKQISCGMTYTNDKVHRIIEKNLMTLLIFKFYDLIFYRRTVSRTDTFD